MKMDEVGGVHTRDNCNVVYTDWTNIKWIDPVRFFCQNDIHSHNAGGTTQV